MSDGARIPRPTPFEELPLPEPPPKRPPSAARVVQIGITGRPELSVLVKRSYLLRPGGSCVPADEQLPLVEALVPHEEPGPSGRTSFRHLPEIVGYRPGTDLVVHGSARPASPVREMTVGVEVGRSFAHRALVTGRRFCDFIGGSLVFTDPEPFEEIPLRYENAYGGGDPHFEGVVVAEGLRKADPEAVRRVRTAAETMVRAGHPLLYPRNRFGKGYVIEDNREAIQGRELPNLEWPGDTITPERLVVGNPLDWNRQPLPVGFGFLDASSFPRCAMFGLPPATIEEPGPFVEVERGLVPSDFSRGNIFTAGPEEIPQLVHPWAGRAASLGLGLPLLRGDEWLLLEGFLPESPRMQLQLPAEWPLVSLASPGGGWIQPTPELHLVDVDVPEERVALVWAGRMALDAPLPPDRLEELESGMRIEMRRR